MNQKPPSIPSPRPDPANLSANELASNQEARCVPWFAGTRKLPLTWIAPMYNLHSRKLKSPPPGMNNALQFGLYGPDPAAVGGSSLGLKAEDATRATTTVFYGTIAGIPCLGPADELVALIFNSAMVWPTRKIWNDGVIEIPTIQRRRAGGLDQIQFALPHGLRTGNKFIVSGLADASFNRAVATTVHNAGANGIQYADAGSPVGWTPDSGGLVSKVNHYVVNDLVRDGASIWQCALDHDAMPNTRPPNATYWTRYVVARATSPNPFPFTIESIGQGYLYWGTSDQTLDAVGEKFLSQTGHPPYRNQVVLVIVNCLLGTRPSAPNIEVILRRKPVVPDFLDGPAAELDADGQANPLCCVAEMITHPIWGAGQTSDLLG